MIKIGETKINRLPLGSSDIPRICLGDRIIFQKIVQYIRFVDSNVEEICATNWGDGTGITAEQAAEVTSLGSAFTGNTDIEYFEELKYFGITSIGTSLKGCSSLKKLWIPASVGNNNWCSAYGMSGLNALEELTMETPYHASGTSCFGASGNTSDLDSLTKVNIKELATWLDSVWHRGDVALGYKTHDLHLYLIGSSSEITSITIPSTYTTISQYKFFYCTGITSVTIPSSVTTIGASAFQNCGLTGTLTLPSSLTSIGNSAFSGCSGLTGALAIPSTCTSIGNTAFLSCTGITKIDLPSGVSIGSQAFSHTDALSEITFRGTFTETSTYCFRYCTVVDTLNISSLNDYSASTITGYGSPTYATNSNVHVYIISTGVELTSITIPSGTTAIEGEKFRRWAYITSVTIPSTVTSIGNGAFAYCSGITGNFTIPTTVTSIGTGAFQGCSGITNLTVPAIWNNTIYNGCGNGTGTFTLNGDLTLSGTFRANTLQFENIIFNGDVDISAIGNNIFFSDAADIHCVKSIRFLGDLVGNFGASGVYHTYSTTKSLEFIEVLGEMTNVKLLYGSNELVSGAIMHLGYNGVAGTPTQIMAGGASKISTIYVNSQSVIDAYAADADWAQYSSKFDLWSNYNGVYKT